MGGPGDYCIKWSKSERQMLSGIICRWNLKFDTNELICETEADWYREQIWGCRGGGQEGRDGLGV